jgi:hypothetical protein
MSKKQKRKPLYKNIKARLDLEDYTTLLAGDPKVIDDIENGLEAGDPPGEIGRIIRRSHPHKWPFSKMVEGAARHILKDLDL